jgi:hypothetical protein
MKELVILGTAVMVGIGMLTILARWSKGECLP